MFKEMLMTPKESHNFDAKAVVKICLDGNPCGEGCGCQNEEGKETCNCNIGIAEQIRSGGNEGEGK